MVQGPVLIGLVIALRPLSLPARSKWSWQRQESRDRSPSPGSRQRSPWPEALDRTIGLFICFLRRSDGLSAVAGAKCPVLPSARKIAT